jgi:putative PIN family toxin of toxin-antitoxin system
MISAVFDTNVLLQAALSDTGPASSCWDFVESGSVLAFTTEAALNELVDVLGREKLRRRLDSVQERRVRSIINTLRTHLIAVPEPENYFSLTRDLNDQVFVDLAIEWDADYLVSRDKDILDLSEDHDFTGRFPNLNIVTPVGFLEVVRAL